MKLTRKEKSELIFEGFITVGLIYLLYLAVLIIFDRFVYTSPDLVNNIWIFKNSFTIGERQVHSYKLIFVTLLVIVAMIVLFWRLKRRYKQMQLRHVISELHYIAEGHYDHRIPFELSGDMNKVIDSIHVLVDSTVSAMEEERKIEQSKDELITNVSHDIRTPLTSIIGYLGLIEDKQYQSQEELLKYTHTAYIKAKQMKILVEDLFEYTKVRQHTTPLNLTQFDMVKLLEQLAADFELDAKKKNMVIEVIQPDSEIMMEADTEKIVRVFNNLISNALKYGVGGKKISIEAQKVGKEVIISVSNDGPEIPEASLNQLFDRFYRVEESRSQETGGTGLGLAIAQSIVALHGGYIYAKSDKDLTRFVLHLPLKQVQNSETK
ncbi:MULTISPECIES: sensor histidine kinase [Carnobacterium]|uniref:histidine kinase n=1 Tax=Carnobacterium divergens TaxID=2748 RepID=A0A2R8A407_CARDV|nr:MULTISPECIES: HAMP domain-containing sensor histidine kinase [Carnobacterium]MCO6019094.1 HAMP domain-containing histidine kinase [Carnobacterium divergens]MDT1940779.1 HAMP domain-containing histidine kinase [Carnobacterium divergens]MDT1943218.1 HAMP domain-containing histidine kinase [Carnobacterium divergens]MDT1949024.1 HAMP domain-containing histidine kinase [Carnobacterium divergens]MDT1951508.1 HAMP domain-containing histidine kinase [Carnobacterium divergens]